MAWDKNTKPKRLRTKHKRQLVVLTLVISFVFVSVLTFFDGFKSESSMSVITKLADQVLTEEEKRVVWDGMSKEGKEVIGRHIPVEEAP